MQERKVTRGKQERKVNMHRGGFTYLYVDLSTKYYNGMYRELRREKLSPAHASQWYKGVVTLRHLFLPKR